MALPVWPGTVPSRPVLGSVSVQSPYPDAVVTEFEDGPPRMRRQSHTGICKLSYQLKLSTAAEMTAFDAFTRNTLGNGTSHFMMDVWLPGSGCVNKRCFIEGGRWTASPQGGGVYLVSFTLGVFL